jgi:hypothetical protein
MLGTTEGALVLYGWTVSAPASLHAHHRHHVGAEVLGDVAVEHLHDKQAGLTRVRLVGGARPAV